jgi:hypothetical protein
MKEFELDGTIEPASVIIQRQAQYGAPYPPVEIKSVPGIYAIAGVIAFLVAVYVYVYYNYPSG